MTMNVSSSQPSSLVYYTPCDWICDWIKDLCKRVFDLAIKIIKAISNCFSMSPNMPCTGLTARTTINSVMTMTNTPNPRNIISFYYGLEANNNHVTLAQILNWDDGQLEAIHNYIQWLFPLETSSGPNPTAPILDQTTIQVFRNDALLKNQLLNSFRRMLSFYGLQMNATTRAITRASNFNARAAVWLTPADRNYHNFLRITRIIHSLSILGLQEYAHAFLTIMQDIARNEGSGTVGDGTLRYWQTACS
jgi:hypothetical protein